MEKIWNSEKNEAFQKDNISSENSVRSGASNSWKFSDNFIAIGLLASAVCLSFLRYITLKVPVVVPTTEFRNSSENYIDDKNIADIDDVELDNDEDWEDEEDLSVNEVTSDPGIVIFEKGDTLAKVLERAGINKSDVHGASAAVSRVFHLKKIKPGLQITVKTNGNDETSLRSLEFKPDKKFRIVVEKVDKRFIAKKVTVPLKCTIKKVSGLISSKAPAFSMQQCGIPKHMANDALRALKHVTNISELKSKMSFDLVYEQYCTENGELLDSNLLAILASVDGKVKRVYKFSVDGSMQYVDSNGTILSSKKGKTMFIKPLAYKKITSQFGYRYHPINGRGKMHTGVDLSASIGTPVRATASGKVTMAQNYRGYGLYVKIKHSGNYGTAYAHLSRTVVEPGQFVKQGQIIGYSGNSGYSTGAHLHYEVMHGDRFINPLSFVPQPPRKLSGKELVKFSAFKKSVNSKV